MRPIPTRLHGIVDYAWGVAMIASPSLFGFSGEFLPTVVAWVFGLGAIAYSLVTAYELGAVPLLPVPLHLSFDAAAGGLLALLPLLFGFRGALAWTFAAFGLFSLAAAFLTRTRTAAEEATRRTATGR